MVPNKAVSWLCVQITLFHCFPGISILKDFRGHASECTPVPSNVVSEKTQSDCC